MRSISRIKKAVDGRKEKSTVIVERSLKTPASVREKEKKDDSILKIQRQLRSRSRALERVITENTKKLDQINDEIVEKMEKAIKSGDEIINAAKKRAKSIILDANDVKSKIETQRMESEKLSKALDRKAMDLEGLNNMLSVEQKEINARIKTTNNNLESAQRNYEISKEKLKKAQEALNDMMKLFLIVIEKATVVASIDKNMLETISTNTEKADKMYTESKRLMNIIKIDMELNNQRAKELNKKEAWIKDRQMALARSAREIKRKMKNGR